MTPEEPKYTVKQLTYSVDRAYDRGVYSGKRMMKEKIEGLILKWENKAKIAGELRDQKTDPKERMIYKMVFGTANQAIADLKALLP